MTSKWHPQIKRQNWNDYILFDYAIILHNELNNTGGWNWLWQRDRFFRIWMRRSKFENGSLYNPSANFPIVKNFSRDVIVTSIFPSGILTVEIQIVRNTIPQILMAYHSSSLAFLSLADTIVSLIIGRRVGENGRRTVREEKVSRSQKHIRAFSALYTQPL